MKKVMMCFRIKILLLVAGLTLVGCDDKSNHKILKKTIGRKIVIPQNIVKIPDTTTNYTIDPQSKYKLVHYVLSQDCIDCYMKFMVSWKEIFNRYSSRQDVSIYIIYNTADIFDLTIYKNKYGLNYPFFLDPDTLFIKNNNDKIVINNCFNTLLLRNDTAILYGNIENIAMKNLILGTIDGQ